MAACDFCDIVAGTGPAEFVDADDHAVAFMDIQPATPGHTLVIPRRHAPDLWSLDAEEFARVMTLVHRVAGRIRAGLRPDGLNLVQSNGAAAFQSVFHLHVHLVPRYRSVARPRPAPPEKPARLPGDGVRRPWIPTPGDPDAIQAAAERIRAADG